MLKNIQHREFTNVLNFQIFSTVAHKHVMGSVEVWATEFERKRVINQQIYVSNVIKRYSSPRTIRLE